MGVITMLSVMSMGYISLRVVQRIRQFKRLASEIQRGYQGLDAEFPFAAPLLPTSPTAERLKVYLQARRSLSAHIAPPVEARAREILAEGEAATITDVAQLFGAFYEFLEEGTGAHLATLRAERMGPSEFFWIHGYVLHSLLEGPEGDERRRQIESTLAALEQGSAPLAAPSRRFEARVFREDLDRRYAGYPELEVRALGEYGIGGEALACLDILGATQRLHEGLGLTLLPPHGPTEVRTTDQTAGLSPA